MESLVWRISAIVELSFPLTLGPSPPIEISSPYAAGSSVPANATGTPPFSKIITYDSGFPMILETAFVASLRMSEATTESTGTFVNKFRVGIFVILFFLLDNAVAVGLTGVLI